MPPAGVIIGGLTAIANDSRLLAYAWHAFFFAIVIALIAGWRPSHRTAARLLALPLISVSLLAWRAGNPFNAAVFALVFFALLALSLSLPRDRVQIARVWVVTAGSLCIVFGWTYPHFVHAEHWVEYVYAAPLGLVPCPTLAVLLGFAAVLQLFRDRTWSTVLALTGLVYGVIGVFRLGVALDYGLLAAVLFVLALLVASSAALKPAASFSAGPVPQ